MILKGSQRGGARSLALHVLNDKDNDHVRVADLRGVAATTAYGAFCEMEAVAKCTHATKPFFSVSFNPPKNATLTTEQFETAFALVEKKMGLENSQRITIWHEKSARMHAHVVWNVVQPVTKTDRRFSEPQEVETLAAVKLGLYKRKLNECSKELFLQFGLELPKGYQQGGKADPLNYDLKTWQQCARLDEEPRDLKALVSATLRHSDGVRAFSQRMEEQGLFLARGDKRGFVLIHHTGEILALTRYSGLKAKDLRDRLGDPAQLPTVEQAQSIRVERLTKALYQMQLDLKTKHQQDWQPFKKQAHALKTTQRQERRSLAQAQHNRTKEETLIRATRLRKGLTGWWDRFTGDHGRTVERNKQELDQCQRRDRAERESVIARHLQERREIQTDIDRMKQQHARERQQFRAKMGFLFSLDSAKMRGITKDHIQERDDKRQQQHEADRGTGRERTRSQGPEEPSL
jgi:hypothetical protein